MMENLPLEISTMLSRINWTQLEERVKRLRPEEQEEFIEFLRRWSESRDDKSTVRVNASERLRFFELVGFDVGQSLIELNQPAAWKVAMSRVKEALKLPPEITE